jgi:8-oxo-dGTP pyrophosphatase MutT (NUDIX family)
MAAYTEAISDQVDVTVAAIAERDGAFLLIEERSSGKLVLNQPAGHLEAGETLIEAAIRETLEESACDFEPEALLGIYIWRAPETATTYVRLGFRGRVGEPDPNRPLDHGIVRRHWLSRDEMLAHPVPLRSPMVLRCIDDYLAGVQYPLSAVTHWDLTNPKAMPEAVPAVALGSAAD